MDRVEISVHPTFIIFIFVLIYFGSGQVLLNYLVALTLHEFAHYYVASKFGCGYNQILFMPYGLSLQGQHMNISKNKELLIALAGPLCNLLLCVSFVCMWWCVPSLYNYSHVFVMCNLSIALTNLAPVFPLDGGRALIAMLSNKKYRFKLIKLMRIVSAGVGVILIILFAVSLTTKMNTTYLTLAIFLISSSMDKDASEYVHYANMTKQSQVSIIRQYAVSKSVSVYELVKYINPNSYCVFYVYLNGKLVN